MLRHFHAEFDGLVKDGNGVRVDRFQRHNVDERQRFVFDQFHQFGIVVDWRYNIELVDDFQHDRHSVAKLDSVGLAERQFFMDGCESE